MFFFFNRLLVRHEVFSSFQIPDAFIGSGVASTGHRVAQHAERRKKLSREFNQTVSTDFFMLEIIRTDLCSQSVRILDMTW